jgi:hypothetical protein
MGAEAAFTTFTTRDIPEYDTYLAEAWQRL